MCWLSLVLHGIPCTIAVACCRYLQSLTKLTCFSVEVALPPLACVARQLSYLLLHGCLLFSDCPPGKSTDVFSATKWEQLQVLDLTCASIDAPIMAVDMPALHALRISKFSVRGDGGGALQEIVNAFGAGCPHCTSLEYAPPLLTQRGPCHMYDALTDLQLTLDPATLCILDLSGHDLMRVPSALTKLECMSASTSPFKDLGYAEHYAQHLQLHAALSVAATCIKAGAPLHTLGLAHCRTCIEDTGSDFEHDEYDLQTEPAASHILLRPLCAMLHGLACLKLVASPHCGVRTVNEMVSATPDLCSLVVSLDGPYEERRILVCSGLHELQGIMTSGAQILSETSCTSICCCRIAAL
jgi:hypothetical protein